MYKSNKIKDIHPKITGEVQANYEKQQWEKEAHANKMEQQKVFNNMLAAQAQTGQQHGQMQYQDQNPENYQMLEGQPQPGYQQGQNTQGGYGAGQGMF
jgi:hypothetical protein